MLTDFGKLKEFHETTMLVLPVHQPPMYLRRDGGKRYEEEERRNACYID
jgi:hypothetical protein